MIKQLIATPLRRLANQSLGGLSTLNQAVLIPEVEKSLKDWISSVPGNYVLIGGLAVSFYARPRATTDVDLLFYSEYLIPDEALGFRRTRPHCFEHRETNVEVETLTSSFINLPDWYKDIILKTSVLKEGIYIASPGSLVALKLLRWSRQDQADIVSLFKSVTGDTSSFKISKAGIEKLHDLYIESGTLHTWTF